MRTKQRRNFVTAFVAIACLFTASQSVAGTWADSAGNTVWTTSNVSNSTPASASWVSGFAPANAFTGDSAVEAFFPSVANAQPSLTVQTRILGVDFEMPAGGLTMTGTGNPLFQVGVSGINATGQTSGTNSLTGFRILQYGNGTWNIFSNADTAGTSTFTVNPTVAIQNNASLTIQGQRNGAAGNVGIINFNGVISNTNSGAGGSVTVEALSANNTVNFAAANTFDGGLNLNGGTLTISASERIANTNKLTLNGGNFNVGGFAETLGVLGVGALNGTLTLGDGGSFAFASSSAETWTGSLTIAGAFVSGSSVRFGLDGSGLDAAQLAAISIVGFSDIGLDSSGYLTAVIPEPSSFAALAGLCGLGMVSVRRRKRA